MPDKFDTSQFVTMADLRHQFWLNMGITVGSSVAFTLIWLYLNSKKKKR